MNDSLKEFEEFKNIYADIFKDVDLKQFEEIQEQANKIIDLKKKIKELANNENRYYVWIIEECLELLKENNSEWFGYFGGIRL